ncbi:polysaccharide deacetylase family protein [Phytoactinopolyspora limicola]|uniref:polysaccharide deacetylase family protein n=1 Tax=Phytoactinopolyspora limicola TaxID=2715536 RepID=UPI00140A5856|nr:polysaccharide deacetylase family protein [Phytoactinopolyspora limicola]
MRFSAPLLGGLVVVVIALSMANKGSADEPDTQAAGPQSSETDAETPMGRTGGSVAALGIRGDGVTLTFDDGPHPTHTPQVLDLLAERRTRAIFCLVGGQVRQHPELVQRIVADGHVLCNHTESHDPNLAARPPDEISQEIATTSEAISEAAPGAEARYFRQPARHVTPEVAPIAEEHGLAILDWTVDSQDWKKPGAAAITDVIAEALHPGAVILLHDGGGDRSQTVDALPDILDAIQNAGYRVAITPPLP